MILGLIRVFVGLFLMIGIPFLPSDIRMQSYIFIGGILTGIISACLIINGVKTFIKEYNER